MAAATILFDHVHLAFDEKVILRDVSFMLETGHTKIFLGASGAGKSTILRLTLGLLKPDAGRIFVNGEQIDRQNVGYKLYEELQWPASEADARVSEVLGFVGLGEFVDRMPSELSGGPRRRVRTARVTAAAPG